MADVDEYGIPIKKVASTTNADEYGIPIKKKIGISTSVDSSIDFPAGTPQLKNGLPVFQSGQAPSIFSPEKQQQEVAKQQAQSDLLSQFPVIKPKDRGEIKSDKTFMQSVNLGLSFLTSKALKGIVSLGEGAEYLNEKTNLVAALSAPVVNAQEDWINKNANLGLNPEFEGRNVVEKTIGALTEVAPSLATVEFGGFMLSGMGNAHQEVQKMKENGAEFKNGSDDLYILGNGIANELLMKELPASKIISKLPAPLRSAIMDKVALTAFDKITNSGEKLTAENLLRPVAEEARSVSDKIVQGGINFLKNYAKTEGVFAGLTLSTDALKKISDKLAGADNFNQSPEDIQAGLQKTFGDALAFTTLGAGIQGITDPGALIRKTPIHDAVLKSLREDPSDANVNQIGQDLEDHLTKQGANPEQIANSLKALQTVHEAIKAVPKSFGEAKTAKAVDLITGRKELQDQLAGITASKEGVDESMRDVPTKEESLVQAKLDQSNDKLRELATDNKYRYNFDEEKGTYSKQLGENSKPEEITKDRYELEQLEKQFKKSKPIDEEISAPILAKAEDDLTSLKQVTDKVKKYDASLKRLTEAKNNRHISENDFTAIKQRFDDVMKENNNSENAIQEESLVSLHKDTENGKSNTEPNIISEGAKNDSGNDSETQRNYSTEETKGRVEATRSWLQAIGAGDTETQRNSAKELLGKSNPTKTEGAQVVLADNNVGRENVRASGGNGKETGAEATDQGARPSQESRYAGQSGGESGTANSIRSRKIARKGESKSGISALTETERRGMVTELQKLSDVRTDDERTRVIRNLQKMLDESKASEEKTNELIDLITNHIQDHGTGKKYSTIKVGELTSGEESPRGAGSEGGGLSEQGATPARAGQSEEVQEEIAKTNPVIEQDQEEIDKHITPIADQMVKIENELSNAGFDLSDDYDEAIQLINKKTGEQVEDPDEIPKKLHKMVGDYEEAIQKLSKWGNMGKHLSEARTRFKGTDISHEEITTLKPKDKVTFTNQLKEPDTGEIVKDNGDGAFKVLKSNDVENNIGGEKLTKVQPSEKETHGVGFAPYRSKNVNTLPEDTTVRNSQEYQQHVANAKKAVEGLGLKITDIKDTWGGYVDSETGKPVQEVSNIIRVEGSPEKIELLAAILGESAPEKQDSVLIGAHKPEGIGTEHIIETGNFDNAQKALKYLKENNIEYFTVDTKTGDLTIIDHDSSNTENILTFISQLDQNGLKEGKHLFSHTDSKLIPQRDYGQIIERGRSNTRTENGFDIDAFIQRTKRGYEPSDEVKSELPSEKSSLELAKDRLAEARAKLNAKGKTLRISSDPEQDAKDLFDYHKALVDVAKEYIKKGIKDVQAFAKELGEKVDDLLKGAWEEASGGAKKKLEDFVESPAGKETNEEKATVTDATIPANTPSAETIYGTKNSVTEALREGMGMPPVEIPKDRSEDTSLHAWKEGTRTPQEIVDDLLSPDKNIYNKSITPNDEPIMREYIKGLTQQGRDLNKTKLDLEDKIQAGDEESIPDLQSVNQQLLNHYDQMERALNASKTAGNIWHKVGAERQLAIDEQGLVLNSIQRIKTLYGDNLSAKVKQELADLQLKYDNLEAKNAQIEEQLKKKQAETTFKVRSKRNFLGKKRTVEEFTKERNDILEDLKRDFKKSFTNTYATLPGIPQLNAISPHVARLMRLYGEEAGAKLDDVLTKVHEAVKDVVEGITKQDIADMYIGKYSEKKTISELTKKLADFRSELRTRAKIVDLEKGIITAAKRRGESSPGVKALQKKLADLKKQSLNEYAEASIEDLKKQQRTIQTQIDKGEVFKVPVSKRAWENNPEWIKNNKEKNKLRDQLKRMENDAYDSKKSQYMRGWDWGNRWGRRVIFFGANAVYTKLSSAAVLGSFLHRPIEQGLGKVYSKIFPAIARNAPIEGNLNARAEGKWYAEFSNPKKFLKNTYDIAKTGETELSRELSTFKYRNHLPIVDLFAADTHIMIKDPVKRATFEASLINQLQWYADRGIDGTHPLMLESARQAAYKRAEYEIFQNTQRNGNMISKWFNELEKKGIEERNSGLGLGKVTGNAKYTAASLYHFFVPINTVPLNIIKRQMLGFRLPYTAIEAFAKNKDVRDGILNMTNEESDVILRQLKKGTVSAAYWTLGFVIAGKMAGGLYTQYYPDKHRSVKKSEQLNILGTDIPKNVQHNAQLQALQEGATWGVVYHYYIKDKGTSQLEAISRSTAAEGGTLLKQVPAAKMAVDTYEATQTPSGSTKFINGLKRRVGVKKASDILTLMGYDEK